MGGTGSEGGCSGSSFAFVITDNDCVFAWGHLANASPLAVVVVFLADPFSELCLLLLLLLAVLLESQLLILLLSSRLLLVSAGHVGGCVNAAVPSSICGEWRWPLFTAVVVRVAASSLAVDD